MPNIFITATDTDAGKTYVACALVHALVKKHYKVAVYKPVSAGCQFESVATPNGSINILVNEDAQQLGKQANCLQTTAQINPITYAEPIAPHIAAIKTGTTITLENITFGFKQIKALHADFTIVEGAGGWRLPLGEGLYMSDFVKAESLDVILVVNMKLGCLNHAILTYESIINDGLNCIAWVANCPENMPYLQDNINELENVFALAPLAILDYQKEIEQSAIKFNLSQIIRR